MAYWVSLFLTVLVIGMVSGLMIWASKALPLIPDVVRQILYVCIVVIAVLVTLSVLLGHTPMVHFARIG